MGEGAEETASREDEVDREGWSVEEGVYGKGTIKIDGNRSSKTEGEGQRARGLY